MMETVVIIAITVLGVVFSGAFLAVVFLCRHKYCRKVDMITSQHRDMRPDVHLISSSSVDQNGLDVELGEVTMNAENLESLLDDERWIDDATGLVPHCLHILKTCHRLTERMVAMTMREERHLRTSETHTEIVTLVKKIGPRVDGVVESMYPPLDPRLLEARCTALVLSVSHLVMITKHVCHLSGQLDWIDQSLADVEESLTYLKEGSMCCGSNNQSESDSSVAAGHLNNRYISCDESSRV